MSGLRFIGAYLALPPPFPQSLLEPHTQSDPMITFVLPSKLQAVLIIFYCEIQVSFCSAPSSNIILSKTCFVKKMLPLTFQVSQVIIICTPHVNVMTH